MEKNENKEDSTSNQNQEIQVEDRHNENQQQQLQMNNDNDDQGDTNIKKNRAKKNNSRQQPKDNYGTYDFKISNIPLQLLQKYVEVDEFSYQQSSPPQQFLQKQQQTPPFQQKVKKMIKKLAVDKNGIQKAVIKTTQQMSIAQIKKNLNQSEDSSLEKQQKELVIVDLNIDSAIYNTKRSPAGKYIPIEQYQLLKDQQILQNENQLLRQQVNHLQCLLDKEKEIKEFQKEMYQKNELLQKENQVRISEKDKEIKDLQLQNQKISSNRDQQELEILSKLQEFYQYMSTQKFNRTALFNHYSNSPNDLNLANRFFEILFKTNTYFKQQQQRSSSSAITKMTTPVTTPIVTPNKSEYKEDQIEQQQQIQQFEQ